MLAISYIIILLICLFLATAIDIRQRRIPNWLTVSVTLLGLGNSFLFSGLSGLGEHILAMFVALIFFFIFYLIGAFGAGDAKLMAALGAVMGFPFIIIASLLSILIGGVISLVIMLKVRGFKGIILFLYLLVRALFTGTLKEFNQGVTKTKENTFPFSIAITLGSVLTLWYIYPNI